MSLPALLFLFACGFGPAEPAIQPVPVPSAPDAPPPTPDEDASPTPVPEPAAPTETTPDGPSDDEAAAVDDIGQAPGAEDGEADAPDAPDVPEVTEGPEAPEAPDVPVVPDVVEPPSPATAPTYRHAEVDPATANGAVTIRTPPHRIAAPARVPNTPRLVLFLPATGQGPSTYLAFLTTSATMGHHTIGLAYPNAKSVYARCAVPGERLACFAETRTEIVTGQDTSQKVTVGVADSIEGRVRDLLTHLHRTHPEERWNTFLGDQGPRWDRMIVVGHSQGGAHAFFLASRHALARVVALSAPNDVKPVPGPAPEVAPWLSEPWPTPPARRFAMGHPQETTWPWQTAAWKAASVPGATTPVDIYAAPPPYNGAQALKLSKPSGPGVSNAVMHRATAADATLPRDRDDRRRLEAVWRWLIRR